LNTPSLSHRLGARTALTRIALAAVGLSAACAAHATVITFNGLPGASGDAFAGYTESGFTVSPSGGSWLQSQTFGAPVPSVYVADFHGAPFGSLTVTGGTPFIFESIDIAPDLSAVGYEVRGYKGGIQQFSFSGSETPSGGFHTLASTLRTSIDALAIDVSGAGPGSINVDNIHVSAVPEPQVGALALVGLGLVTARLRARRGSR
jgi:hypothetical protein